MRARLRGPPDLAQIIKELQAAGKTSLRAIEEGLNAQKIPTSRGDGEWTATQLMRVFSISVPGFFVPLYLFPFVPVFLTLAAGHRSPALPWAA